MKNHTPCRIASALLLTFCLLGGAPTQAVPAPSLGPYLVLAHYMPGGAPFGIDAENNYWYAAQYSPVYDNLTARPILYSTGSKDHNLEAHIAEIRIAKSYGIDGFLVDELEDTQGFRTSWLTLFRAAEIVGGFKIGLQPDYATLGNPTGGDHPPQTRRDKIKHWIELVKDSPALLRFDGKPVVIPYGAAYPDAKVYDLDNTISASEGEKRDVVDWMAAQGIPIAYAASHSLGWPVYTQPYANDPKKGFQTFAFANANFSPGDDVHTMAGAITTRQRALNYWPKDFMLIGEATFLYMNFGAHWYTAPRLSTTWREDWAWNVAHRDRIHWVEIITWNDWGESAVSPSVNTFMSLQPITRYYADWFKTGHAPRITKDVVTIFHRATPAAAVPTKYPKRNAGPVPSDEIEALAMLTAPATIVIKSGDMEYRQSVGPGIKSLIKPFALGVQSARVERHGAVVASITSPIPIHDKPARENLWIDGATSAFPPRPIPLTNWTTATGMWSGAAATRTGTGLALVGNGPQLGNISVSGFVSLDAIMDGSFAGVVAHANGNNFYRLVLGQWDGKGQWRLCRIDEGKETVLASGNTPLAAHAPRGLRLDCVGEHLIAFLDNHLVTANVYDYPDWQKAPLTYGQVGVMAEGTQATFTRISLKSYDPEVGAP